MRKHDDRKETVKHDKVDATLVFAGFGGGRGGGTVYLYSIALEEGATPLRFRVEVKDRTHFEAEERKQGAVLTDAMSSIDRIHARIAATHAFAENVGRFAIAKVFEFDAGPDTMMPTIRSKMTEFWENLTDQQANFLIDTFVDLYFNLKASYRLNSTDYDEKTDAERMYNDSLIFDPEGLPRDPGTLGQYSGEHFAAADTTWM